MQTTPTRIIEASINVAIVITICLLGVLTIKYFSPHHSAPVNSLDHAIPDVPRAYDYEREKAAWLKKRRDRLVGRAVNLPAVDWNRNGRTLVLVLSGACSYCADSAPFYRRLASETTVRRVAVFPHLKGAQYLNKISVPIDDIQEASLESVGAEGTPTVLLVDNAGVISDAWVGLLSPEQEIELLSKVRTDRAGGL